MLRSPGVKRFMEMAFVVGEFLGTLPFNWCSKSKHLSLTRSTFRTAVWITTILCNLLWACIMTQTLLTNFKAEVMQRNHTLRYHSIFTVVAAWSYFQYQICLAMRYQCVPQTFNSLTHYVEYFEKMYYHTDRRSNRSVQRRSYLLAVIMSITLGMSITVSFVQVAYIIANPNHVAHFHFPVALRLNRIDCVIGNWWTDGAFNTIVYFIIFLILLPNFCLWPFSVLPFASILNNILFQLSFDSRILWTRNTLRNPGPAQRVSMEVIILARLLEELAAPLLLVLPANLILGIIVTGFQAIREEHLLQKAAIAVNCIALTLVYIVLNKAASGLPHLHSANIKRFMDGRMDKVMEKAMRALRPPLFKPFGIYTLGNDAVISGLQIVLDNLVSCLSVNPA